MRPAFVQCKIELLHFGWMTLFEASTIAGTAFSRVSSTTPSGPFADLDIQFRKQTA